MKSTITIGDCVEAVPVFFTPKMVAHFSSASPSAAKPAQVVDAWLGLALPIAIVEPEPVTANQLKLAHSPEYVDQILLGEIKNGFGNKLPVVAATLPYTTGAMLAAAREAIRNGKVAVAPCSGFHHAGYASASGYCTFNGLVVTAMVLKASGLANKVGILDFDMHYGDGTDELIAHHQLSSWIVHYSPGKDHIALQQSEVFLSGIPAQIAVMRDCDIILFQAGADPHVNDPLGGYLTTAQLRERDKRVFETAKSLGLPIAWNLAGGYQVASDGSIPEVLTIHNNTMLECVAVYACDLRLLR